MAVAVAVTVVVVLVEAPVQAPAHMKPHQQLQVRHVVCMAVLPAVAALYSVTHLHWCLNVVCSADVAPSMETSPDGVLQWLEDFATANNNDAGFTAAAIAAKGMTPAYRITGRELYAHPLAVMMALLPHVPVGALYKIQSAWRHAVDGKPATPLLLLSLV